MATKERPTAKARATPRLWYLPPSHYCEKARAILVFKKIPFELVNLPYGDHTALVKASGQDYAPYLEIPGAQGVRFPEIADWAEARAPKPTLYPGGSRPLCRLIEHWAHQVVEEAVWKYVLPDVADHIAGERERWVFVEMQERKRGPLDIVAMRREEFLQGVRDVCGLLQDDLGQNQFLLGPAPSLADFAVYGALHPLKFVSKDIPTGFEKLQRWHARLRGLTTG